MVEAVQGQAIVFYVIPDLALRPGGQRVDLNFRIKNGFEFSHLEFSPGHTLTTSLPGDPALKIFQTIFQYFDFSHAAAIMTFF